MPPRVTQTPWRRPCRRTWIEGNFIHRVRLRCSGCQGIKPQGRPNEEARGARAGTPQLISAGVVDVTFELVAAWKQFDFAY